MKKTYINPETVVEKVMVKYNMLAGSDVSIKNEKVTLGDSNVETYSKDGGDDSSFWDD